MAHSMFRSELSNKVDCTQTSSTTDTVSTRLLSSGFTPPSNKDAELKALRSANCELQARLSGYLVLPQMMEKKAKECRSWKLRACKAEKELKLTNSLLTQSQLEELRRQNVVLLCEESLSVRSDTSADSSLDSRQTVKKPCNSEKHLAYVTEHKSDDTVPQRKSDSHNLIIDTDDVDLLKQQITTYVEDFENERKDRERLVAVCNKQRRDLEILHADRNSLLQQLRQVEDELHLLRRDNASMKLCQPQCREAYYSASCEKVAAVPEIVLLPRNKSPTTERRASTLLADGAHLP